MRPFHSTDGLNYREKEKRILDEILTGGVGNSSGYDKRIRPYGANVSSGENRAALLLRSSPRSSLLCPHRRAAILPVR